MGIAKQMMMESEQKAHMMVNVLVDAQVLQKCDIHDDIVYQNSGADNLVDAYKLANTRWNDGFSDHFKDRREMTDLIKSLSEDGDYAGYRCEQCASQRD